MVTWTIRLVSEGEAAVARAGGAAGAAGGGERGGGGGGGAGAAVRRAGAGFGVAVDSISSYVSDKHARAAAAEVRVAAAGPTGACRLMGPPVRLELALALTLVRAWLALAPSTLPVDTVCKTGTDAEDPGSAAVTAAAPAAITAAAAVR